MTNEELNTALYKKVFAEQEKYREWLLSQPPNEILNHCYEYTVREDIVLALEEYDLSDKQCKALLRFCPQGHFSVPTSDFFQTPPHDGRPCLRLTVPTAKSVVDFHHQVITRAEHTKRKVQQTLEFTGLFWRRGWDSNPCAIARKLISRAVKSPKSPYFSA